MGCSRPSGASIRPSGSLVTSSTGSSTTSPAATGARCPTTWPPSGSTPEAAVPEPGRRRPSLRRRVRWLFASAALVVVVVGLFGVYALQAVLEARESLAFEVQPAQLDAEHALAAMVDQETGLRGFVLSDDPQFLEPYEQGIVRQQDALTDLADRAGDRPSVTDELRRVEDAERRWREEYAQPTIEAATEGQPSVLSAASSTRAGSASTRSDGPSTTSARPWPPPPSRSARTSTRPRCCSPSRWGVRGSDAARGLGHLAHLRPIHRGSAAGPHRGRRPHQRRRAPRTGAVGRPPRDRPARPHHGAHAGRPRQRDRRPRADPCRARGPRRRPRALQPGPGAVRLRGVARSAGAAAQGHVLLPAPAAALRRAARRARRRVHRLRRRRGQADADPDQRPPPVLPRRAHDRAAGTGRRVRAMASALRGLSIAIDDHQASVVVGDLPDVWGARPSWRPCSPTSSATP